ncbi:MAG: nitrilase-related carbon-nitrogen hydrolase [Nitrospirota bacterium]|jgi:predicted amidohydrolase
MLTPELAVSGYSFLERIGTDWILSQPDEWMAQICGMAVRHRLTVFLSHPERDRQTRQLHNSLFVNSPDREVTGVHLKINVLRVGSKAWSPLGTEAAWAPGFHRPNDEWE